MTWQLTFVAWRGKKDFQIRFAVRFARFFRSLLRLSSSTFDRCLFFSTLSRHFCWNLFWLWKHFTPTFLVCEFEKLNFSSFNSSIFHFLFRCKTLQLALFLTWVQRWNDCYQILKAGLFRRVKLTVVSHAFAYFEFLSFFHDCFLFLFDLLSWRLTGRLENLEELAWRLFSRGLVDAKLHQKRNRSTNFRTWCWARRRFVPFRPYFQCCNFAFELFIHLFRFVLVFSLLQFMLVVCSLTARNGCMSNEVFKSSLKTAQKKRLSWLVKNFLRANLSSLVKIKGLAKLHVGKFISDACVSDSWCFA